MAIEKIVCPVLNKPFKPVSVVEVFVRFNKAEKSYSYYVPLLLPSWWVQL